MPNDIVYLGSTPSGEECAQVGAPDYRERARKECGAFIRQIRRVCGEEPNGAVLYVKSNPHDFGTYYTVAVRYDADNQAAEDYAFKVETNEPEYWDSEAKAELAQ